MLGKEKRKNQKTSDGTKTLSDMQKVVACIYYFSINYIKEKDGIDQLTKYFKVAKDPFGNKEELSGLYNYVKDKTKSLEQVNYYNINKIPTNANTEEDAHKRYVCLLYHHYIIPGDPRTFIQLIYDQSELHNQYKFIQDQLLSLNSEDKLFIKKSHIHRLLQKHTDILTTNNLEEKKIILLCSVLLILTDT